MRLHVPGGARGGRPSKLPQATGSRAHALCWTPNENELRGVAVCWLAELDLVGWCALAGRKISCARRASNLRIRNKPKCKDSNAREFPGVPGVPKYLGTRLEEPPSGVERGSEAGFGPVSQSSPVFQVKYAHCGNNNYGVHDVGRQGLMRTAITRHMPSATRQRREGRRKRRKEKNVGAAGLGVEMHALLNRHPQIPRRPLGFVSSELRNVRC